MVVGVLGLVLFTVLQLNYVIGCGTTNLEAGTTPQYLSSPSYPSSYLQSYSCSYKITADSTYSDVVIQIKVHNASLEPATGCWRDSVEIIDGGRDFMRSLTSFCGSSWPKTTITSTGDVVLILFNTDVQNNDYYGFLLSYWIVKKPMLLVNETPWTSINYGLFGICGGLVLLLIVSTIFLFMQQYVRPKYQEWKTRKMRRGSVIPN